MYQPYSRRGSKSRNVCTTQINSIFVVVFLTAGGGGGGTVYVQGAFCFIFFWFSVV